ncbi:hypothetical protein [Actinocrispum wychmicini]|uniref:Uncharacterized protein n=1 Tax=Actinocrispum wychmicini TaxID=1213861 RepID=A0A4R2JAZ5_9PSEU|nr:hypothetical protein [Actinocrispum wychmicini]TCO55974.1 hypothetical protein EV192_107399 [Actinocrispum wychmicini]
MSIGRERLGELLALIVSEKPADRVEGADTVRDWAGSFSAFEARVVVRVLAVAATVEERDGREAQLLAILTVFDPRTMTRDDIAPVLDIDPDRLDRGEREYVNDLLESLGWKQS